MSAPLGFVRGAGSNNGPQLGTLGTDKTTVNQTRLMVVVAPLQSPPSQSVRSTAWHWGPMEQFGLAVWS
jgi:hypothetical protein